MENRISVAKMPEELEQHLRSKNLITGKALVFATADMDVNCDIRKHILLLTENELIHGFSPELTDERRFNEYKQLSADYSKYEYVSYAVSKLTKPAIDTLVVGGIFSIYIDDTETAVCAFTNAYKGRINRLAEVAKKLIDNEEVGEDLLFEEEMETFCRAK